MKLLSKEEMAALKADKPVKESAIERHYVERKKREGGVAFKFTSTQRRSVPDRLSLDYIPSAEHRHIVGLYVKFVEVKRKGAKLTDGQQREAARLTSLGYAVYKISSKEEAEVI